MLFYFLIKNRLDAIIYGVIPYSFYRLMLFYFLIKNRLDAIIYGVIPYSFNYFIYFYFLIKLKKAIKFMVSFLIVLIILFIFISLLNLKKLLNLWCHSL